ncbi:MAG: tRNA (adenosine(37)-N6)-threonylcarbamoyltransferase complex ATPase subunit type 1 TsaE [Phycisphaerae bacterium]|jgi:tRNA threonylcarbamoyladenosine biosynthesis protein TsaE|nr:tRNA (adenosine(37)-N6)-threonylcarbamoyltransferase complex ATPase subunit type 1 TsaE [Phycisphaerae bacterium]
MLVKTIETQTVEQTRRLACDLVKKLPRPAVVALSGQLGAGKTQFIKGLGEGLGLDPQKICSATFVLIAEYGEDRQLVHIDAYRFDKPEELENIGWYELLDQPQTVIAIEWADKVQDILPPEHLNVQIEILDDHRRQITLTARGQSYLSALDSL